MRTDKDLHGFNSENVSAINEVVSGKTIESVTVDRSLIDDQLVFTFTDGTSLSFMFDGISTWEIRGKPVATQQVVQERRATRCECRPPEYIWGGTHCAKCGQVIPSTP
ncbi:MAG: hypothetical protein C4576_11475 [Desulfobacteraceae bacterium]|nr:MAG: hypothetical protein C4576_11475 [Desulfobacteraceae bacterium]